MRFTVWKVLFKAFTEANFFFVKVNEVSAQTQKEFGFFFVLKEKEVSSADKK